jgi:peptide/nickel transport system permease protein
MLGAALMGMLSAVAITAPILAPFNPTEQHLEFRLKSPGATGGGGRTHWLGTDEFGRDLFSRLVHGARIPLIVGITSALLGAIVGMLVGVPAGYLGGRPDAILSTLIDVQLSMPFILLALAVVALFGPSVTNIVLVFALTSWPTNARVARAAALSLRATQFVEAAHALGAGSARILGRHIVGNAVAPTLVLASVQVAQFIIFESAFGFFGLGVPPPAPTWGNMLASARGYLHEAWWMGTFPGIGIALAALAANLIGDASRDVLDPRDVAARRQLG